MKNKIIITLNLLLYVLMYIVVVFIHLMTEPRFEDNILGIFDSYSKFHLEWYLLTLLFITLLLGYNIKVIFQNNKKYWYREGLKFAWVLLLIVFIGFIFM